MPSPLLDDPTFDVSSWDSIGPYRLAPDELLQNPRWPEHDFRLQGQPINSMARTGDKPFRFHYRDCYYDVPPHSVIASTDFDLYGIPRLECLWLR